MSEYPKLQESRRRGNLHPYEELEARQFVTVRGENGEVKKSDPSSYDVAFFGSHEHSPLVRFAHSLREVFLPMGELPILNKEIFEKLWTALIHNIKNDTTNKNHPAMKDFFNLVKRSKGSIRHLGEDNPELFEDSYENRVKVYYRELERFLVATLRMAFKKYDFDPNSSVPGQESVTVAEYYVRQLVLTSRNAFNHRRVYDAVHSSDFIPWTK